MVGAMERVRQVGNPGLGTGCAVFRGHRVIWNSKTGIRIGAWARRGSSR